MTSEVLRGILIPFLGTSAGAACVFFMKKELSRNVPAMPYFLSFAAGAMMYVVAEELIPEMSEGSHSHIGVLMFAAGFTVMMALDVALG